MPRPSLDEIFGGTARPVPLYKPANDAERDVAIASVFDQPDTRPSLDSIFAAEQQALEPRNAPVAVSQAEQRPQKGVEPSQAKERLARPAGRAVRDVAIGLSSVLDLPKNAMNLPRYGIAKGLEAIGLDGAAKVMMPTAAAPSDLVRTAIDKSTNNYLAPRNDFEKAMDTGAQVLSSAGGFGLLGNAARASQMPQAAKPLNFLGLNNPRDYGAAFLGGVGAEVAQQNGVNPILGGLIGAGLGSGGVGGVQAGYNSLMHPVKTAKNLTAPAVQTVLAADNPVTGTPGLRTGLQSPVAKEGRRLEKRLGTQFTLAELTGNRRAMDIEDYLANSAHTSQRIFENAQKRIQPLVGKYQVQLSKISDESAGPAGIGDSITKAYDDLTGQIVGNRRAQAKIDFGLAHKVAGEKPFIAPNNFINTLEAFIKEGESRLTTPAQRAAAQQAKGLYNKLMKKTSGGNLEVTPITIDEMANGLSAFSAASSSPTGLWKGIATAGDRRFAANAAASLEKDLDGAIGSLSGTNQEAAGMLKIARDRYREFSGQLKDIENTTLGKYLGSGERTPERVAEQLKNMRPTEITGLFKVLDKANPETAQATRRFFLENALAETLQGKGQATKGLEGDFFNAKLFTGKLPYDEQMTAILEGQKGGKTIKSDMDEIFGALNRIVNYGGTRGGSPTARRLEMGSGVKQMVKNATYDALLPSNVADIMLDPAYRTELAKAARSRAYDRVSELMSKRGANLGKDAYLVTNQAAGQ